MIYLECRSLAYLSGKRCVSSRSRAAGNVRPGALEGQNWMMNVRRMIWTVTAAVGLIFSASQSEAQLRTARLRRPARIDRRRYRGTGSGIQKDAGALSHQRSAGHHHRRPMSHALMIVESVQNAVIGVF